jgi:hypothetical protein
MGEGADVTVGGLFSLTQGEEGGPFEDLRANGVGLHTMTIWLGRKATGAILRRLFSLRPVRAARGAPCGLGS